MAFNGGNALRRFLAFLYTTLPSASDTAGRTPCPQQSCVHLQCPFRLFFAMLRVALSPVGVLQFGFRLWKVESYTGISRKIFSSSGIHLENLPVWVFNYKKRNSNRNGWSVFSNYFARLCYPVSKHVYWTVWFRNIFSACLETGADSKKKTRQRSRIL